MERMGTIVRVGTARCKVESWRRKSVTEEFGRFSTLDRNSGGMRTAAHAASTAKSTILLIGYAIPLSGICSRSVHDLSEWHRPPVNTTLTEGIVSLRIYYIRNTGRHVISSAVGSRATPGLLPQGQITDHHPAVGGFAHVVDEVVSMSQHEVATSATPTAVNKIFHRRRISDQTLCTSAPPECSG